ncbi:glycosyltransferase [Candidatus Uhrbacteria bacterium]|nr:glycosyltransferase [Candidatus Uhrbacteria bacterium]
MRILLAIPALNEEAVIRETVEKTAAFVSANFPGDDFRIAVADNGSTDRTWEIVREMEGKYPGRVFGLKTGRPGKGLAIRTAWSEHPADICAFMDADLSTDLRSLPALIDACRSGGMAIGSRQHPGSVTERTLLRRIFSACYRLALKAILGTRISDLPCGFKAISAGIAGKILPETESDGWFFDTELTIRAERAGYPITEIPIRWHEANDPDRRSRVSLIKVSAEYLKNAWRLRGEFRKKKPEKNKERKWAVGLTILAVIVAAIPVAFAVHEAHRLGLTWRGNNLLAPGDFGVYLSYIEQAKSGRLLFDNLFDAHGHRPALHGLWLLTGWAAAGLHLTPTVAFHLMRLALIPLLGLVAWRWIRELLERTGERVVAMTLVLFGGGIGFFFQGLYRVGKLDAVSPDRPVDLWVSEAFPFLSSLNSPHFLAAWILLLLALHQAWRAIGNRSAKSAAWAGLAGAALLTFHPFHAVTLLLVPGSWLTVRLIQKNVNRKDIVNAAIYLVALTPVAAYHVYVSKFGPDAAVLAARSLAVTPNAWHLLLGFGLLLPLAGWGIWRSAKPRSFPNPNLMVAWAVMQPLAFYGPFVFQRRLLLGWLFPLAILSAPAAVRLWHRWSGRKPSPLPNAAALLLSGLALFNTVPGTIASSAAVLGSPTHRPAFYFDDVRLEAVGWVRKNAPSGAVFLSSANAGYDIAGWGNRTVLAGHWANTDRLGEKQALIARFFGNMTERDRQETIGRFGLTHIWFGPEERAIATSDDWRKTAETVFSNGEYEILAIR